MWPYRNITAGLSSPCIPLFGKAKQQREQQQSHLVAILGYLRGHFWTTLGKFVDLLELSSPKQI